MESSVFLSDLLTVHEPELRNSLQCRRATFRFMERIPRNFRALDPEPGREGALRRPRRAQRRNDAAPLLRGRGHRSAMSLPKSGSWKEVKGLVFLESCFGSACCPFYWGTDPMSGAANLPVLFDGGLLFPANSSQNNERFACWWVWGFFPERFQPENGSGSWIASASIARETSIGSGLPPCSTVTGAPAKPTSSELRFLQRLT